MGLKLAFKAFLKAMQDPKKAQEFVEGTTKQIESSDASHIRLLSMLQHSGRLVDFLKEDITSFSDAQIGAAVRKIHQDCGQILEDIVTIRPVMEEREGEKIHVAQGYDPASIKVIGQVKGEPPYTGILVHKGWKAHKRSLPKKTGEHHHEVICPAEVEIK